MRLAERVAVFDLPIDVQRRPTGFDLCSAVLIQGITTRVHEFTRGTGADNRPPHHEVRRRVRERVMEWEAFNPRVYPAFGIECRCLPKIPDVDENRWFVSFI